MSSLVLCCGPMGNKMSNGSTNQKRRPATVADLNGALSSGRLNAVRRRPAIVGKDVHEVYPNIFLSSLSFARDTPGLEKLGITHVLNIAQGTSFMHCDTSAATYASSGIGFLGICANDTFSYDLSQHFDQCIAFMHEALQSGGKVLVHCLQGWSRSPTIVAAYLMTKKGMGAKETVVAISEKRQIFPNSGFLKLLADLDEKLLRQPPHAEGSDLNGIAAEN